MQRLPVDFVITASGIASKIFKTQARIYFQTIEPTPAALGKQIETLRMLSRLGRHISQNDFGRGVIDKNILQSIRIIPAVKYRATVKFAAKPQQMCANYSRIGQ